VIDRRIPQVGPTQIRLSETTSMFITQPRLITRSPAARPPRHSPRARTGWGAVATVPSSGRPAPPMGPAHPKDLPGPKNVDRPPLSVP
jgi:hypothetical protein